MYPALKLFHRAYNYKIIANTNPYWLTFPPISDLASNIVGTFYILVFGTGFLANILLFYMHLRCKSLRTGSYMLVLQLAVTDFIILITCAMAAYNYLMRGPALGYLGCQIYGFMESLSCTVAIGMVTITTMEQYTAVSSSIRYSIKYSYVVWLASFLFHILPLFVDGLITYAPEADLTTCSLEFLVEGIYAQVFMYIFLIYVWLIPISTIIYCYFQIIKSVLTLGHVHGHKNKLQEPIRLALIALPYICLWILTWTPYALEAIAAVFGRQLYMTAFRSRILTLVSKTISCLNTFIYHGSNTNFRKELQKLLSKRPKCRDQQN